MWLCGLHSTNPQMVHFGCNVLCIHKGFVQTTLRMLFALLLVLFFFAIVCASSHFGRGGFSVFGPFAGGEWGCSTPIVGGSHCQHDLSFPFLSLMPYQVTTRLKPMRKGRSHRTPRFPEWQHASLQKAIIASTMDQTPDYQTPGGSLSNQDFKKLMMTPRRPGSMDETPVPDYLMRKKKKREGLRIDTDEVFAKPQKKQEESKLHYRDRRRDSKYRDRATERRSGENPDYIDDNKMLREAGLPERKKVRLGGRVKGRGKRQRLSLLFPTKFKSSTHVAVFQASPPTH